MSQQRRPHKRYTPKFFHCDDVPRQTISSAIPELVSVTESSLATSPSNSKPEKILSEAIRAKPILNPVPLLVPLDLYLLHCKT